MSWRISFVFPARNGTTRNMKHANLGRLTDYFQTLCREKGRLNRRNLNHNILSSDPWRKQSNSYSYIDLPGKVSRQITRDTRQLVSNAKLRFSLLIWAVRVKGSWWACGYTWSLAWGFKASKSCNAVRICLAQWWDVRACSEEYTSSAAATLTPCFSTFGVIWQAFAVSIPQFFVYTR